MKTSLVILASVLLVMGIVAVGYGAEPGETPVTATVNVKVYKDVTVDPCDPFTFGNLDQGDPDKPITPGCDSGDINVTNNPSSNAPISVSIGGTNFLKDGTGPESIAIGQVGWNKDDTPSTTTPMTTSPNTVESSLAVGNSVDMYFFLDVPNPQTAGSYSSIFTVTTA